MTLLPTLQPVNMGCPLYNLDAYMLRKLTIISVDLPYNEARGIKAQETEQDGEDGAQHTGHNEPPGHGIGVGEVWYHPWRRRQHAWVVYLVRGSHLGVFSQVDGPGAQRREHRRSRGRHSHLFEMPSKPRSSRRAAEKEALRHHMRV